MEALKKGWPGTPVPFLGPDNVGQGCWEAGVTDNLSVLPAGVSGQFRVCIRLGVLGPPGCWFCWMSGFGVPGGSECRGG